MTSTPPAWRQFPALEKIAGTPEGKSLLVSMEKTRQNLESVQATGSAAEKTRAKLAVSAYSRTFELIKKIQLEMEKQLSATAPR